MEAELRHRIFKIEDERSFRNTALDVFHFQFRTNPVYAQFVTGIGRDPSAINEVEEIPFLPIEFFRTHSVVSGNEKAELLFESSGTTLSTPSMPRANAGKWLVAVKSQQNIRTRSIYNS